MWVLLLPAVAAAWVQDISDHGVGLRWRTVAPLPVLIEQVQGVPDGGRAELRRAVQAWRAACSGLRFARAETGWLAPIVYWETGWPFGPGEVGHTCRSSEPDTGELHTAVIHLNGAFDLSGARGDERSADLARVLAHEIGHVLGIGHSADRDALMYPGILPEHATRTALSEDDVQALCSIYPVGIRLAPPPRPAASSPGPARSERSPAAWLPGWPLTALLGAIAGAALLIARRR